MKLNEYQQEWIDTLKSGQTNKYRGGGLVSDCDDAYCCLGVGVQVCEKDAEILFIETNLFDRPLTMDNLQLRSTNGVVNVKKISPKWKKKIIKRFHLQELHNLDLTEMNDGLSDLDNSDFSHVEIGQFIEENPEAVFEEN